MSKHFLLLMGIPSYHVGLGVASFPFQLLSALNCQLFDDDSQSELGCSKQQRADSVNGLQAWTEQAGRQVGMRKEGSNKLHRLAMAHLYSSWAPPSTWLHTTSPAPACMAAVMAAWSHALQVHGFSYVMPAHSTCHAYTFPHVPSCKPLVV